MCGPPVFRSTAGSAPGNRRRCSFTEPKAPYPNRRTRGRVANGTSRYANNYPRHLIHLIDAGPWREHESVQQARSSLPFDVAQQQLNVALSVMGAVHEDADPLIGTCHEASQRHNIRRLNLELSDREGKLIRHLVPPPYH